MNHVTRARIVAASAALVLLAAPVALAEEATEVTQYGITWTFDKPYPVGQFATGDWWVVGPVTVVKVTPTPGPAPVDEKVNIKKDQWGNTALRNDNRMRNGSMILLRAGSGQGYDSRSSGYDPKLSAEFPLELEAGRSLVSTISHEQIPNPGLCHEIMWASEKKTQSVLRAAAVLTCLSEAPPADAFRPPYAGTEKPIYRVGDLKWDLLLALKPAGNAPSWEQYERYFQRPWLDHIPSWVQRSVAPTENQADYGREHGRVTSVAALMLLLDVPRERKEKLLIGLVQRGIDLSGLARVGGDWNQGGGHGSGRKWPILFASLMLGDKKLRDLPESAVFQEDAQTYYGKGWFGQTALWQMVTHHGPRQPYEEKPPEQWEQWDKTSEGYRCCCNAQAWVGTALAAELMKARKTWNHDAFFDYCDRWMQPDDPYAAARGTHKRPRQETTTMDPFLEAMWREYRKTVPEQARGGEPRKWVWQGNKGTWVPNPRPAAE